MKQAGMTCIVPVYNESLNVVRALKEISQLPFLKQIICVDDGSTDDSALKIAKHFPQIKLISYPENMGKSFAVETGLQYAENENILLIDADMHHILEKELSTAYKLYNTHQADMLILGWKCDNALLRAMRGDIIISGGRFLKKRDLEQVFKLFDFEGYALEVAINRFMIQEEKTTCWFQTSATNTLQTAKYGFVKGWKSAIEEGYSVVSASQFGIIDQFFNFKPRKVAADVIESYRK